jgi:hypothetical protein
MKSDNDIVKRLRALAAALAQGEWVALTTTCSTAADEIERLRKELEESERLLDEYQREAADRTRWEDTND